jgi:hypothetical protein
MAKIDTIKNKLKKDEIIIDFAEIANKIDVSKTKKYLDHLITHTSRLVTDFNIVAEEEMSSLYNVFLDFDRLSTNGLIENPDLNTYKNIHDIKRAIKEATLSKSIGKAKKEIKILFEDNNYMLFIPLSFDAASVYGRGTKWCITQEHYFYNYCDRGVLMYLIDKSINRKFGFYYEIGTSYHKSVIKNTPNRDLLEQKSKTIGYDIDDIRDVEMFDIYNFATKLSCWTDWDVKIDLMFVPIPNNIKDIVIDYCRNNPKQNVCFFDDVETEKYLKHFNNSEVEMDMVAIHYNNDDMEVGEIPEEVMYTGEPGVIVGNIDMETYGNELL